MAPTRMAMRMRMTTSWLTVSRRERFGVSDTTSHYDSDTTFHGPLTGQ
jgi:hypothetical protein